MDANQQRSNEYENLNNFKQNLNSWKPITHSKFYLHRHHKKHTVSQISNFKQSQPRGLIFVWPQNRKFRYERELSFVAWMLSHGLFWFHVLNLFPNGSGMFLSQPPWRYRPPLPTPQNRDFIIEPDWDTDNHNDV